MRSLGSGQRLVVALSPEIQDLIRAQLGEIESFSLPGLDEPLSPIFILGWLLINSARTEELGSASLAFQQLSHIFRQPSLYALLRSKSSFCPDISSGVGVKHEEDDSTDDLCIRWKPSESITVSMREKLSETLAENIPVCESTLDLSTLLTLAWRAFVSPNSSHIPNSIEDPLSFEKLLYNRLSDNEIMTRLSGHSFSTENTASFVDNDLKSIFSGSREHQSVNEFDQEILQEQEEEQEKLNELENAVVTQQEREEILDPSGMTPWYSVLLYYLFILCTTVLKYFT